MPRRTGKGAPRGIRSSRGIAAVTGVAPAPAPGIRIRMYRVGFGDCFLVSLPADGGHRHILVDCGVHVRGDLHTIGSAVQDIVRETGGQLDIVIATHAHQDHISGFATCADAFSKMTVGEVWLPWSEDPRDLDAVRFRQKQASVTALVAQHIAAAGSDDKSLYAIQNLTGNESALKLLKSGINGGRVRFLGAGEVLSEPAGIAGLSVRVLGPPRDPKFLARMDPPSGDRFLRLGAGGPVETANGIAPFGPKWGGGPEDYPPGLVSETDIETLTRLAGDPGSLAFALDQAMNNTSVVTLFSYRGQNLLFPGDAQYGNWQYWVDAPEAQEILADVDFYKVAHHGSLNATPKSALAKMTKGKFAAMVSTQDVPWPSIPYPKLMDALIEKASGVVRSDSIAIPDAPKGPPIGALTPNFAAGPFWYDYTIAV